VNDKKISDKSRKVLTINRESLKIWLGEKKGKSKHSLFQSRLKQQVKDNELRDIEKANQRIREKQESLAKSKARCKAQIYDKYLHQLWIQTIKTIPKFKHLFSTTTIIPFIRFFKMFH
jgi:hypothetical protein